MATNNSIVLLATTLLLIMSSTPLARAVWVNIAQVQILGRLVCSATGNPVPGTPIVGVPNVPVTLSCNGSSTNVTEVLTNPAGFFTFTVGALDALLFHASNCSVSVNLPLANCTLSPPTGILQAAVGPVTFIQTALGLVGKFFVELFRIVPV